MPADESRHIETGDRERLVHSGLGYGSDQRHADAGRPRREPFRVLDIPVVTIGDLHRRSGACRILYEDRSIDVKRRTVITDFSIHRQQEIWLDQWRRSLILRQT